MNMNIGGHAVSELTINRLTIYSMVNPTIKEAAIPGAWRLLIVDKTRS